MGKSITKTRKSDDVIASDLQETRRGVTEVDILWRAYEIYLDNNNSFSDDVVDWLRGKTEIGKPGICKTSGQGQLMNHLVF